MSKKAKQEQPDYVTELLNKGTVTLRANNREDFGRMIDSIPATVRYAAGAVGKTPTSGLYTLRLDLVSNQ